LEGQVIDEITLREQRRLASTEAEALIRLGVSPAMLADAPSITPQLRMIAKTIKGAGQPRHHDPITGKLPPKTPEAYGSGADLLIAWPEYLSASDAIEARKVREAYYSIPSYMRKRLRIETFCVAAGVSPLTILEILTATLVRLGAQASRVIAAVNHPRVVAKTVEMALTDTGVSDRNVLHKHAGFLPTPGGARTQITVTQQANATASSQAAAIAPPPPEATIRRLADRFNLSRVATPPALPSETVTPIPEPIASREIDLIESHYVDDGADDDVREE
jgi:hypothetical protein